MEQIKRNETSQEMVNLLTNYYDSKGVYPEREDSKRFCCPNVSLCSGNLARGMQCHVGYNYGDTLKVVVSSMDSGKGGADTIEKRTRHVYEKHDNPHMKGTLEAVSLLLDKDPEDSINYMAMINACKCCRHDSPDHMGIRFYRNCAIHKLNEYRILKPEIILFQGQEYFSLAGCRQYLHEIEDAHVDPTIKKFLKKYSDGEIECYGVICIHPSARGRSIYRRKEFYDEIFPRIAKYIKEKLH